MPGEIRFLVEVGEHDTNQSVLRTIEQRVAPQRSDAVDVGFEYERSRNCPGNADPSTKGCSISE